MVSGAAWLTAQNNAEAASDSADCMLPVGWGDQGSPQTTMSGGLATTVLCQIYASEIGGISGGVNVNVQCVGTAYNYTNINNSEMSNVPTGKPGSTIYPNSQWPLDPYVGDFILPGLLNLVNRNGDSVALDCGSGGLVSQFPVTHIMGYNGPITPFGAGAQLGAVSLPDTLIAINTNAFTGSTMTSLTFTHTPDIGGLYPLNVQGGFGYGSSSCDGSTGAFSGTPNLTTVSLPPNLNIIGDCVFGNSGLTGIEFAAPDADWPYPLFIQAMAFHNAYNLSGHIAFPNNIMRIANDNFYNTKITGISFAEGGINAPLFIDQGAFAGATELTGNVHFPSYLYQIQGHSTFTGTQITSVSFEPGNIRGAVIVNDSFGNVSTLAGKVYYPKNIIGIQSAFYGTGITDAYLWHTDGGNPSLGSGFNRPITGGVNGVSPSTWPAGTVVHVMCSAYPSFYNDRSTTPDSSKPAPDGRWRSYELATHSNLIFDNGGHGISYAPTTVGCDEKINLPYQPAVAEDGYKFLGWFDADGNLVDDPAVFLYGDMMIGDEDFVIYARWGDPDGPEEPDVPDVPIVQVPDAPEVPNAGADAPAGMVSGVVFSVAGVIMGFGLIGYFARRKRQAVLHAQR